MFVCSRKGALGGERNDIERNDDINRDGKEGNGGEELISNPTQSQRSGRKRHAIASTRSERPRKRRRKADANFVYFDADEYENA